MSHDQGNMSGAELPFFFGPMDEPDGHARITGPCGDTMEIWLRIINSRIHQATFFTDGCEPSIASGAAAVKLAEGKTLEEVLAITQDAILTAIGGLPEDSRHCALLAANTLSAAIEDVHLKNYKENKTMRIAIPLANGRLCTHFGHCERFALIDCDPEVKTIFKTESISAPEHQPGLLPGWLAERGATVIAAEVKKGADVLVLRNEAGIPVWAGWRR